MDRGVKNSFSVIFEDKIYKEGLVKYPKFSLYSCKKILHICYARY